MMELQWPLILFTTLVAWSAGLFGTQALMAVFGVGKRAQGPAWVASAVLLAAGGIAVFFHLEHWERIFNGFGHLTSGITQELIAIVVLAVVAVAYLVLMRKSDDGASVPKWLAWVAVALSVVLVAVMAHSYTMAARPAWDSVLWILYVLGNACVLGRDFPPGLGCRGTRDQPADRAADAGAPQVGRPSPAPPSTPSRPSPSRSSSSSPPAPSPTSASTSTRRTRRRPWPTPPRRSPPRPRCYGSAPWPSARSCRWPPRSWAGARGAGSSGPGSHNRRPRRSRLHARRLLQPGALGLHVLLARPPIAPAGAPPTRRAPPQAQEGGSPPRPSSPVRGNAECFT